MNSLPLYQVDAFATAVFSGNPAAVCPLERWLAYSQLQNIAAENNLSETTFFVPDGAGYTLRWFTPTVEVDLCGHATLAAAYVLFEELGVAQDQVEFHSPRSGKLTVTKSEHGLTLDFPSDGIAPYPEIPAEALGIGIEPLETWKGKTDLMVVVASQESLEAIQPDFAQIQQLPFRGLIATAPGTEVDFVSRFFAPQSGVPEDPVTGSAHTTLTPFWSEKLGKSVLSARQLSARGGALTCEYLGERVAISGKAALYLKGEIYLG